VATYEGQAAVEFAALARHAPARPYALAVTKHDGPGAPRWHLDPRELIRTVCADLDAGTDAGTVSARFHAAVAAATASLCALVAAEAGVATVVLSGGVFQNQLLLEASADALTHL